MLRHRCYEDIGDESRALNAYRRAATLAPQSSTPRISIARVLQTRDVDQAVAELDRALTLSPDDLSLIAQVTRLQIARQSILPVGQRQWREVVESLDRAEKLAPGNGTVLALRAEYLTDSGRPAEAVELLGKATQGPDRKRPETWLNWSSSLCPDQSGG